MALSKIDVANMVENKMPQANLADNVNFRNIIINGDMSIAQRATSDTNVSTGYHTVDRFQLTRGAGSLNVSQETDAPTGQGLAKSFKVIDTSGSSPGASDTNIFLQRIEGQNLQYIKKGTSSAESLTLSFWIKAKVTGTYIAELYDSDNTRQISKTYTVSSSQTWEKKTITFPGDTTGTLDNDNAASLLVNFWFTAGSNFTSGTLNTSWGSSTNANRAVGLTNALASANDYVQLTSIQLEVGETASDFEFLPFDVQLERCKRYFQKSMPYDEYSNANYGDGYESALTTTSTPTQAYGLRFPTELRTTPTLTLFRIVDGASGKFYRVSDAASVTVTANQIGTKNVGYFSVPNSDNSYAYNYRADAEL